MIEGTDLIDQSLKVTVSHDKSKDGKFNFSMPNVRKGATGAQMVAAAKAVDSLIDANGVIEIVLTQKSTIDLDSANAPA